MSVSEQLRRFFTGRTPWRAQVLAPVLVVAGLWIVMSLGTTLYLWWVEAAYDRVFSQNLTSIEAAHSLESICWKTLTDWDDITLDTARFNFQWESDQQKLEELVERAGSNVHTPDEKVAEEELRLAVKEIGDAISTELGSGTSTEERSGESGQRIREFARKVSTNALRLRTINDQLIADARSELAGTHSLVLLIRMLMLLFGPLLGIYLGWAVTRRLQSSVSEIAVTLNDSTFANESQELRVSITRESSIEDVRRQAERVVERLRQVGTELQSARKEVIQSERLVAVGELAAGVAHELRNPLTSVKLLLQHISKRANGYSIGESQLRLILEEVGRMEGTIQGLLDFSRTPVLNRMRHDLHETLRRSLNLVDGRLKQGRIELLTTFSPTPLWIDGDAEQLNQVFVNLFLNSVEAMPNGGQLKVIAEHSKEGTAGSVIVQDTGDGIASDVLTRLFEPFATNKERGTGLGLAISRRIVTDHCGTISAENLPDRGAMFVVELPLSPVPKE
ncbi:MAG: hypothetical protein H7Z17_02080 [Fuerstia sp.]|nr:hypothetical protein [Fuerstiella sp.]